MNSTTIRLNKKQLEMINDSLEASIRICGDKLILRKPEEQIVFDQYGLELKRIQIKILNGIARCD